MTSLLQRRPSPKPPAAVTAPPDPAPPSCFLERVGRTEGIDAARGLNETIARCVAMLRGERPTGRVPDWSGSTRRTLTVIAGAAVRLRWLEDLAVGANPPAFVHAEPTDASLIRLFVERTGSRSLPRLVSAAVAIRHKAGSDLATLGHERDQIVRNYARIGMTNLSWDEAEAKVLGLDRRELDLIALRGQAEAFRAGLVAALAGHVPAAVVEVGGAPLVARGLFEADPTDPYTPSNDRTLNSLQAQLRAATERLSGLEATLPAFELARQESLRPHLEAIERHRAEVARKAEANRERHAQAASAALAPEVDSAARGDVAAWSRIAAAAEGNPAGFPDGFLARWLAAAADAAIEAGASILLEKA